MAPKVVKAMKVSNKEKAKEAKEKEKKEDRQWIAMAFSRVASLTRTVPLGNLKGLLVRGGITWVPFTEPLEPPDSTAVATDVEEEEVPFPPRRRSHSHFEYPQEEGR
jgi:hypothetical protein